MTLLPHIIPVLETIRFKACDAGGCNFSGQLDVGAAFADRASGRRTECRDEAVHVNGGLTFMISLTCSISRRHGRREYRGLGDPRVASVGVLSISF
jgi:hypothetical protein